MRQAGMKITDKNASKTELAADRKKGLGSIIGKISGKGKLETEIKRLSSRVVELELNLQNTKNQLEKKKLLHDRQLRTGRKLKPT
ncbi:MAG: hypothetical protein QM426_02245 [Euryarchaeota archaeon]|nr:hypothetical protein [Euryarchaeota archaeon]